MRKKKILSMALRSFSVLVLTVVTAVQMSSFAAGAVTFTPTYYDDNGQLQELQLYSPCAYMVNLDTGEVILDINSREQRAIASLTKVMTAIVLLEYVGDDEEMLKSTYVYGDNQAFDELFGTDASTADIQPYESVSYYDLLAALLIQSACEAANIIAVNVAGSLDDFIDLMNRKAGELDMINTHFSNAHGLFTQQNYSTAEDVAKMCRYAIDKFPVFSEIVSYASYAMEPTDYHDPGTMLINTNYMVNGNSYYYYSQCRGIKTGTTDAAGRCLATYAVYDQIPYLTVTLGAPMDKLAEDYVKGEQDPYSLYADSIVYYNMLDHIHLYNWAFNMLKQTDFINSSSEVRDVKVAFGKKVDYANLKPAGGYSQMWPLNVDIGEVQRVITVKENIVAPIEKGDVLGQMELRYNGETITTIDLVSTSSVERSPVKEKLAIAKSYFSSTLFKVTLGLIIAGLTAYCIVHFILAQRKYLRKHNR
ncbi:MAG: D-alanyl-D-alanine carboxypeptidase [Ruminococcus sp.]|nr:D-alanyl-D-alanine carboxypeptidase [Ruminococcus sp.]